MSWIIEKYARHLAKDDYRHLKKQFPNNDYEVPVSDLRNPDNSPAAQGFIDHIKTLQRSLGHAGHTLHMCEIINLLYFLRELEPARMRMGGAEYPDADPAETTKMLNMLADFASRTRTPEAAASVFSQYDQQCNKSRGRGGETEGMGL